MAPASKRRSNHRARQNVTKKIKRDERGLFLSSSSQHNIEGDAYHRTDSALPSPEKACELIGDTFHDDLKNYHSALQSLHLTSSESIIKSFLNDGFTAFEDRSIQLVFTQCPNICKTLIRMLSLNQQDQLKNLSADRRKELEIYMSFVVDSLLLESKNFTISTPISVKLALLAYWGGLSQEIHRIFNHYAMFSSHRTVTRLMPTLKDGLINQSRPLIQHIPNPHCTRLIIADNLNPHSIKKKELSTQSFCVSVESVSVLFKFIRWQTEGLETTAFSPAAVPFDGFEFIVAMQEGISLPGSMMNVIDKV